MAKGFNLLPSDLAPKGEYIKLAVKIKKIAIVGYLLFFIAAGGTFGLFYFYSDRLSQSSQEREKLTTSIKALEETEKKLVLTQDRLAKAAQIKKLADVVDEVYALESILENQPQEPTITSVKLAEGLLEVSYSLPSSQNLDSLILSIRDLKIFKNIEVLSVKFSSQGGYSADLKLVL